MHETTANRRLRRREVPWPGIIVAVLWLLLIVSAVAGDTIRVTTWNMEWFPSGKPTKAAPQVEAQKTTDAAAVIEALNPDVLLLQEIRDWDTCERLAAAIKSLKYHVAVCSAFKEHNGTVAWQQEAILSKQFADAAWSEPWKSKGTVDPPRGYAFATFRFGKDTVGFYSVHLKSNLIRGGDRFQQTQLNILKRELAAEQLVAHAGEMEKTFAGLKVVIGGDFNTNQDQAEFVSERTLGIFTAAGFVNCSGDLSLARRITHPGKGRYRDTTFDYLWLKNLSVVPGSVPEVARSRLSDHWPVTVDIDTH